MPSHALHMGILKLELGCECVLQFLISRQEQQFGAKLLRGAMYCLF